MRLGEEKEIHEGCAALHNRAMYGAIPSVERTQRARAAPMIALMGLAAVAVVAVVALTTQSRAVEMVAFPQDDLGILKEMVSTASAAAAVSTPYASFCFEPVPRACSRRAAFPAGTWAAKSV